MPAEHVESVEGVRWRVPECMRVLKDYDESVKVRADCLH